MNPNAQALFEAAEYLKTESQIEINDSNLLDDNDLKDFESKFKLGNGLIGTTQKYNDIININENDNLHELLKSPAAGEYQIRENGVFMFNDEDNPSDNGSEYKY